MKAEGIPKTAFLTKYGLFQVQPDAFWLVECASNIPMCCVIIFQGDDLEGSPDLFIQSKCCMERF